MLTNTQIQEIRDLIRFEEPASTPPGCFSWEYFARFMRGEVLFKDHPRFLKHVGEGIALAGNLILFSRTLDDLAYDLGGFLAFLGMMILFCNQVAKTIFEYDKQRHMREHIKFIRDRFSEPMYVNTRITLLDQEANLSLEVRTQVEDEQRMFFPVTNLFLIASGSMGVIFKALDKGMIQDNLIWLILSLVMGIINIYANFQLDSFHEHYGSKLTEAIRTHLNAFIINIEGQLNQLEENRIHTENAGRDNEEIVSPLSSEDVDNVRRQTALAFSPSQLSSISNENRLNFSH